MPSILLIEDQRPIRDLIEDIIHDVDDSIEIQGVSTKHGILETYPCQQWDCIISDFQLDEGNIVDILGDIIHENDPAPKLLISGYISDEVITKARGLGFHTFLQKPFDPTQLVKWLEKNSIIGQDKKKEDEPPHPLRRKEDFLVRNALFAMDKKVGLLNQIINWPSCSTVSVQEICIHALRTAQNITKAKNGILCLYDSPSGELVEMARIILQSDPRQGELRHPIAKTPFKPLLDNAASLLLLQCKDEIWPNLHVESDFLALTIKLQGQPAGVLCLTDIGQALIDLESEIGLLELLVGQLDITLDNKAVHAALQSNMKETLIALARILDARDHYTKNHSANVSKYSVKLAKALGLPSERIEQIRIGGLVHDMGKVGTPDAVLLKKGPLTDEEYEIMKLHPVIGYNCLAHIDSLGIEKIVVRHHHERWDGRGYPDGLLADATPLEARIVGIADAIDAMTTSRCYRKAQPLSFCIEQLKRNSGTQFDPLLVEAVLPLVENGMIKSTLH